MEDQIRELRPDCIFSDMYFPWTVDIADELHIPRILYNLSAYMCYSIMHNLQVYRPHKQPNCNDSENDIMNLSLVLGRTVWQWGC
ncbi:hypothetical protein KY290_031559 [Solanum tuberosum]|uniref:Uncharacterized protein n=1 Tax=Solanum tuberosum TaxID=4113 RepID=A0ABQ7UB36_SOLTU|nr:hypothetical protein KY285_030795 [Solanum tuberosum]KAH0743566.1 hypothetical protein KY290_031559 [Solanum tuberosum]